MRNRLRSLVTWIRGALAWAASHPIGVIYTTALIVASIGFGLAWLPLGFIFPGVLILAIMTAYRWRVTFGPRGEDPPERVGLRDLDLGD